MSPASITMIPAVTAGAMRIAIIESPKRKRSTSDTIAMNGGKSIRQSRR